MKERKGFCMNSKMGQVGVAIGVVGVALLLVGVNELRLSAKALPTPQTISYQQLVRDGCGNNAHIRLTNVIPVTEWLVYSGKGDDGPWDYVYLPAVADDNPWVAEVIEAVLSERKITAMPQGIHVLLKFMRVKNVDDLTAKLDKYLDQEDVVIPGTIINEISSVNSQEKKLLQGAYRGIDVEKALILEVGRTPSKAKGTGLSGGGGVTVIVGLWVLIMAHLRARRAKQAAGELAPTPASPDQLPPISDTELLDRDAQQRARDAQQLAQFNRDER